MSDTPNLPVPAVPMDNMKLAKLAAELASNIRNLPAILKSFNLTEAEFAEIETLPFFKKAFENSTIAWEAADNAPARIKIQTASIIEDALPTLGALLTKADEALPGRVELGKLLTKWAELGDDKSSGAPGEKFSITINLGEDKKLTFEKDVTPIQPLIEEKPNEPA